MIDSWLKKDQKRSKRFLTLDQVDQIAANMDEYLPKQQKIAHQLIYGWVTLLRPPDYRRPVEDEKPVAEKPEEKPAEESKPDAPAEEKTEAKTETAAVSGE